MTAVPYIPPYEMHETGIEFGEQTYPWMLLYGQVPLRCLTRLLSPHGLLEDGRAVRHVDWRDDRAGCSVLFICVITRRAGRREKVSLLSTNVQFANC